jgi:hypothetical protein
MSSTVRTKKVTKFVKTPVPVLETPVIQPTVTEIQTPVIETPVVETESVKVTENSLETRVKDLRATVSALQKVLKTVDSELKNVSILYQKETRENNKKNKRKNRKVSQSGELHGFVKEVPISDDLAEFLGLSKGSLIARPQVTRAISKYVKEHDLAKPENKSIFNTDAKLEKLLGKPTQSAIKKKPELGVAFSYFNLQTVLKEKGHFIKKPAAIVV